MNVNIVDAYQNSPQQQKKLSKTGMSILLLKFFVVCFV